MHNISYRTFDVKTSRQDISNKVLYIVNHSGDRYGTDRVTFHENRIFNNEEEAREWIHEHDGFYAGIAVKFYDYSDVKPTAKIDELEARLKENLKKKAEYISAHSVKTFKAQFIGCQCCGSKLSRERILGEMCPLCRTDLRAGSTLERIKGFDVKHKEICDKIKAENQKQQDRAKVKWLVKFEYHS